MTEMMTIIMGNGLPEPPPSVLLEYVVVVVPVAPVAPVSMPHSYFWVLLLIDW